jgi:hypothetical protein
MSRPGYAIDDCEELFGNTIDRRVLWKSNPDLSLIAGQTVRVRFVLRDVEQFSFRFHDGTLASK